VPLSTLLEKLRGFFTPAFLVATVTPLLCFILVNAAILAQFNPAVSEWAGTYLSNDVTGKVIGAALFALGLIVVAYFFSTLNLTLRLILEGEKSLPKCFRSRLLSGETARLDKLGEQFDSARNLQLTISKKSPSWADRLEKARQTPKNRACEYKENDAAHVALEKLDQQRWHGDPISSEELENVVTSLQQALTTNPADLAGNAGSKLLDRDHVRFVGEILQYAQQRADKEYIDLFNEKEFNFSRYTLAPTRMGNVARSVDSYAQSRYHVNLVFFWTRLQKALQGKKDYYSTLQDAKAQLDFSVSLFWLTIFTVAIWLVALPFLAHTRLPLLLLGIIGPLFARGCYLIGVQNYVAFADLLRSSLDLFRFELLTDLKLQLPKDGRSEQELWELLNKRLAYGEDPLITFTYKQE